MSDSRDTNWVDRKIDEQASSWLAKMDAGLSASEQDAFFAWMAEDPEHGERLRCHRRNWKRLDWVSAWRPEHSELPNPDLLEIPTSRRILRLIPYGLAASLILGLTFFALNRDRPPADASSPAEMTMTHQNRQRLEDGSVLKLKDDAVVSVRFVDEERRVTVERGEAFFEVAHDPSRPFIVEAQGVAVRAVGTAFNVKVGEAYVEVIVTEGKVSLNTAIEGSKDGSPNSPVVAEPVIEAQHRALVPIHGDPHGARIGAVSPIEVREALSWQHGLITFHAEPLAKILVEFNQINQTQLTIGDPEIGDLRISGTFRSDNVEGFAGALRLGFDVSIEYRGPFEIVVRKRSL